MATPTQVWAARSAAICAALDAGLEDELAQAGDEADLTMPERWGLPYPWFWIALYNLIPDAPAPPDAQFDIPEPVGDVGIQLRFEASRRKSEKQTIRSGLSASFPVYPIYKGAAFKKRLHALVDEFWEDQVQPALKAHPLYQAGERPIDQTFNARAFVARGLVRQETPGVHRAEEIRGAIELMEKIWPDEYLGGGAETLEEHIVGGASDRIASLLATDLSVSSKPED